MNNQTTVSWGDTLGMLYTTKLANLKDSRFRAFVICPNKEPEHLPHLDLRPESICATCTVLPEAATSRSEDPIKH